MEPPTQYPKNQMPGAHQKQTYEMRIWIPQRRQTKRKNSATTDDYSIPREETLVPESHGDKHVRFANPEERSPEKVDAGMNMHNTLSGSDHETSRTPEYDVFLAEFPKMADRSLPW